MDVDGVGLWGGKWKNAHQGWCSCLCHSAIVNVPAHVELGGYSLCRPCAELQVEEATGMSFIDYVGA